MAAKFILALCAQALLAQCVLSQCTSRAAVESSGIAGPFSWAGPGLAAPALGSALAYDGLASPLGYNGISSLGGSCWTGAGVYPSIYSNLEFTPTSGGGLPVSSSSPIPPTGISIVSENVYEGILEVVGELPFVGTTVVDGVLPTHGAGAINHGCGNSVNAMTALSETSSPASVATTTGFGYDVYGTPACGAAYVAPIETLEFTPTSGGALPVTSASAVPPTGIVLSSETVYEGPLTMAGELPFVGTVGVEGVLPTAGAGAVNHACGNGINAMASGTTAFTPAHSSGIYAPSAGFGSAAAITPGFGFQSGWAGRGYGRAF